MRSPRRPLVAVARLAFIGAVVAPCCLLVFLAALSAGSDGVTALEAHAAYAAQPAETTASAAGVEIIIKVRLASSGGDAAPADAAEKGNSVEEIEKQPPTGTATFVRKAVAVIRILVRVSDCLLRHWISGLTWMTALV